MKKTIKERVYEIVEAVSIDNQDMIFLDAFDKFMITLISLNTLAVILETVESLRNRHFFLFRWFEVFSMIVFTAEYVLRLWSCTVDEKYNRSVV
ncbi:hypothetical protein [Pseudothermotoga thermarum]|uniref:hypothetical protein n=1 Tax=Pseudothermotoga thermarum TaxID=119394 RepID=UPI0002DA34D8|nr:hypothetical protein [Pseudothermotoga thermarum]